MSQKSIVAALLVLSLASCAFLTGCAGEVDDTKSSRFDDVRGKCFLTKVDLFLAYSEDADDYCLAPASGADATSDMPVSIEDFQAHPEKFGPATGPDIIDVIPAGTHIEATYLGDVHVSAASLVFGKILEGKFSGKRVGLWDLFDDPGLVNSPTASFGRYEAKRTYLAPAHCPN